MIVHCQLDRETHNKFHDNNITTLDYIEDPQEKPRVLESYVNEAPADAEVMFGVPLTVPEWTKDVYKEIITVQSLTIPHPIW